MVTPFRNVGHSYVYYPPFRSGILLPGMHLAGISLWRTSTAVEDWFRVRVTRDKRQDIWQEGQSYSVQFSPLILTILIDLGLTSLGTFFCCQPVFGLVGFRKVESSLLKRSVCVKAANSQADLAIKMLAVVVDGLSQLFLACPMGEVPMTTICVPPLSQMVKGCNCFLWYIKSPFC